MANYDSAIITWGGSPYDGGKIVTGFIVEYSLAGSNSWMIATENCHSLSYVVQGLKPGCKYVFRIRSVNVHGSSGPSKESDVLHIEELSKLNYWNRI